MGRGKRWLVNSEQLPSLPPFQRYIEPFLGGAAIFFYLKPTNAVLADINQQLITTYKAIRDDYQGVEKLLKEYHTKHCKDFYYNIRSTDPSDPKSIAAKLIYLNRTCWNGLYRVNKKGQFNVPMGTRSSIFRCSDNFQQISELLKNTDIVCADFETIIDQTGPGDLLFVDPPYTVKHNHNNFVKYNESIFKWSDQSRLKDCLERAKDRGVYILMTNACHNSVQELYGNIGRFISVKRASSLSGKVSSRKMTEESLFVSNF